jgi:hypothetical protein
LVGRTDHRSGSVMIACLGDAVGAVLDLDMRAQNRPGPESESVALWLRAAQADPAPHRNLIVRVAGYSDYFCDLGRALQDEIIARTEHDSL